MKANHFLNLCCVAALLAGCSGKVNNTEPAGAPKPTPVYFQVDPATAGTVTGTIGPIISVI